MLRRMRRRQRRLFLESLEQRSLLAAIPTATLVNVPPDPLMGENVSFTVRFDNTSPTDTGFGPYVDLYLPATGVDGAGSAVDDGLTFTSATYLGSAVQSTVITLTAAGVAHPFAKDASGNPLIITPPAGFREGDQLVVLQVPYGSFTPAQPAADIVVTAATSNLADVNVPLPIRAQAGFRFGNDALDNPSTDPTITGAPVTSTVTPTLFRLTKTYLGPEDETTTGPNFPRQYRISVDVANGQVITDLDLTDVLPDQLQFVAGVTTTPGGATAISTPSTTTPGGTLTRRFASITGGPFAIDAQMTFSFYVPRVDGSAVEIINPATGDDATAIDDARAEATWNPLDARDPQNVPISSDATTNDHTLTVKSIATQKTSRIVNDTGAFGLSPGDTVEYVINFQVSDYFAFQNIVLNDLFSDGQNYVAGSATLSATDGHSAAGSTSGAFAAGNLTLNVNFTGGSDRLLLRVSDELASRGFSPNGRLVGGAIPDGGTGGPPPPSNPPLPFGPTQGTVRFRTIVQDSYAVDFPSGEPALNPGDPISNSVTISGSLLNVADLTPNGNTETDNSSASNKVSVGSFFKTVYAINGVSNSAASPGIAPGDTVTYRLRYFMPTGDVENLSFADFLPLPIFDVDGTGRITGFDDVVSNAVPATGRAKFGPGDTFRARSGIVPTVANNSNANSVTFTYGTYVDPANTPVTVDILFTVTVSDDPFADQLLLSNGAQVSSNNTVLESITSDAISQVVLEEPALNISKGVVATNNPAGVFTPTPVGPVAFNAPGTTGARFTGTINSAGLAANPIDSNLRNIDQGDLVTYAIVVENTGSSPNGAFDIVIRDTFPEGMAIPNIGANDVNLRVTDGAGNPLPFDVIESAVGATLGSIRLRDPSANRGAIGPGSIDGVPVQDGSNIVIITFDLLTSGNRVNQIITDVATLVNYAGSEGGPDFTTEDLTDDANVQIANPAMTKTLVSTEIVNTTNANNEAVIGELATYRVRITVPEGTTPSAVLTDTLDAELAFVEMVSSNLPSGVTLTGSLTPAVANSGRNLTWTLGNIVNSNTNNATPEVIELVYTVVVVNTSASNANDQVNNSARLTYTGQPNPLTAAAANIRIIEPQVQIDKSVSVLGGGSSGDAGDAFVYSIVLSNPPGANQFTADAFDVTFSDLFQAGLVGSPLEISSFTITDTAGLVTAANFELVTDPGTGRLLLRTTAGGAFDMLVNASRTIAIQVNGEIAQTVSPGQVIPNDAEVRWTSLDGVPNPNPRSPHNPDSTERTGAGGVNDYLAADGATINIINVALVKAIVTTSEVATTDPNAVVVGEIIRYRVTVAIPEFTVPTRFQFVDLFPAGTVNLVDNNARVALVSDAGDNLVSTTLTDPDPAAPALYLTGDEDNVDTLVPEFPFPAGILSIVTVGGRVQATFDMGLVTNPAAPNDNDFEFLVAEFNALVTNVTSNQAGTALVNEVSTLQDGVPTGNTASVASVVAEPSITNLEKTVVETVGSTANVLAADVAAHDAGDVIHYAAHYSNAVGDLVSTAYNVRLVDTLPAAKMTLVPGSIRVFRNGTLITTGFVNNTTGNTLDISVNQVAPGVSITVTYDAVLTTGVVAGESVPNTANLTYTSLPGLNGTPVSTPTNPTSNTTGSANTGAPGSTTGERTGADGVGGALNDYADTASASVPIFAPELDKNILDTNFAPTGSDQFNPSLVDLTIGETVTYRLTITFPEGTATLNLSDLLPQLSAGTVTFVSGEVVAIGGNISGSALAVGSPGVVAGSTVTFGFGTVVNNPDGVRNELDQIVVDIVGQVTDLPENVAGVQVNNVATLDYGLGTVTDNAVAEIVEPVLDIQKSVSPLRGDAGSVFTYTILVSHLPASTAAAIGVFIRDALNPGDLELIAGSVTVTGSTGALILVGNNPGDAIVTVRDQTLPLGESLTITYQARLTSNPDPGDVVPNIATLDYASLFLNAGGRPYTDSDPAQVTVNSSSIAGVIYSDLNNNGVYQPGAGETLITTPVTLQLTGVDHLGNPVSVTIVTSTGTYVFDGLRPSGPGGYTITQVNQPTGFLDGKDSPGTPFGGTGTNGGTPRDAEAITSITIPLGSNTDGVNYNFGELLPATVGDFVWNDLNLNGRQDAGEPGLIGVTVTLTGTNDLGAAVTRSQSTIAGGAYSFAGLRPGTYRVTFTAPAGFAFTVQNASIATDATDSDASVSTGQTANFTLVAGETELTVDAGLFQVDAQLNVDKVTIDDTSVGDGNTILVGEPIRWRYTVTNTGNVPLANVTVTDNQAGVTPVFVSGDANSNGLLDVTETWIFSASGTSEAGAYANIGTARGEFTDPMGNLYVDTAQDASSYFGANPQIAINKVTVDGASAGDGRTILVGESITWRYTVTNVGNIALSNVTVTDNQAGVTPAYVSGDANNNGRLERDETWIYEATGTAVAGAYTNTGTARGTFTDTAGHSRADTATDPSSYFGANPQIDVDKVTVDDTSAGDGRVILSGESIVCRYTVTNTGNVALSNVTVTDSQAGVTPAFVSGDTDGDSLLDLTETWIFEAPGTAVVGSYSNTGTARGSFTDSAGHVRTDTATDASSYFGANPQIAINKVTIDDTAVGDSLTILVGEPIRWRYTVTNVGNVALANVTVTDNQAGVTPVYVSGDANNNDRLDLNETWVFSANGTSEIGAYANIGTARGSFTDAAGHSRTDTAVNASSYFGADPQIAINKVTVDGTSAGDGRNILIGESIIWRYTVTNAGNIALSNVVVTDNQAGVAPVLISGDTDGDGLLDRTETWIYEASGTSIAGSYSNTGTARGSFTDTAGHSRTDTATDPSSYFGADPQIAINKVTVDDTSAGDGRIILAGEDIVWRYTVRNVGNVPLSNVTVTDNEPGVNPTLVSGDVNNNDLLDLNEVWIFTANGVSEVGAYANTGTARGRFTDSAGHIRTDAATDASSYFGANPQIAINKVTIDDTAVGDGLTILVGEPIRWRYTVANAGNVVLSNVTVTDNQPGVTPVYVSGDANNNQRLERNETWIFVATGTSVAGAYANIGTARGSFTDTAGHSRTDTAVNGSSYFGANPQIAINKVTVDEASAGDGRTILVGESIIWRYTVTNVGNIALSNVTVTDNQPGVTPVRVSGDTDGDNRLDRNETWIYEAGGTSVAGSYSNIGTASGSFTDTAGHTRTDVAANASSYFGADPQIAIDKVTIDDTAIGDGISILVGESIVWRYTVTNVGNVPLSNVTVTDNRPGVTPVYASGDANNNGRLDLNETWIFRASGTAQVGVYTNIGTAQGSYTDAAGHTRTDAATDASSYFGANPQVAINKVTVDDTAIGDGITILVGESIVWRYTIRNVGNVALSNVVVTDDQPGVTPAYVSGDTNNNDRLERNETWIFEASGTSVAGAYINIGTARGGFTDTAGHDSAIARSSAISARIASASDTSSYFGADPQIAINKVTVDDTSAGDGRTILVGESIRWRYTVRNVGNVALSNVTVTDNQPGVTPARVSGDTDGDNRLDRTEVWVYEATGTAVAGAYANAGTANGSFTDIAGHTRTDTAADASSYFGANPQIAINKVTVDGASAGDGNTILVGESIRWRYTVTNVGNVALSNVAVADNQAGVTPVFVSGDANNNGRLDRTEVWVFSANGTAQAGAYSNIGTARGDFTDSAGHNRADTASDPSSYFGARPQLDIQKFINGEDADTPPGPSILVGAQIVFTFEVRNRGNVALAGLVVVDDNATPADASDDFQPAFQGGDADGDGLLDRNEVWRYRATRRAIRGQQQNIAVASARFTDTAGHQRVVTDDDPANYFGRASGIVIVPDKSNQSTPLVKLIDRETQVVFSEFLAYEASFKGGVRVAVGDIDGDGVDEIVTSPQRGRAPEVRVFEQDGTELTQLRTMVYDPSFEGGVAIAIGDVNGDGAMDLIAGPTFGAMPVHVYYSSPGAADPIPNTPSKSFFPFGNQFQGGVELAAADMGTFSNGATINATVQDGRAEVIVGNGPGRAPTVQVYDLSGTPAIVDTILPLQPSFRGGVSVEAGRVNSDPIPDILVAAGAGGGSQIEIWSGRVNDSPDVRLQAFAAFGDVPSRNAPVNAAMLDLDGDGQIDGILAAQGTNGTSNQLRFFNVDGSGRTIWNKFPGVWNVAALGLPDTSLLPVPAPSSPSASSKSTAEQLDRYFAQSQAAATPQSVGSPQQVSRATPSPPQQPVADDVHWENPLDAAIAELANDDFLRRKRRAFGR